MKYQLSVLCPAFRNDRWVAMYDAIGKSFSGSWELVLVTEKPLPDELKDKPNIKVVFSERAPMHKQQQGLTETEGEWITVCSDDSLFLPSTLDKTFELVKTIDYKTVIIMKYLEGENNDYPKWYLSTVPRCLRFEKTHDFMKSDVYYYLINHFMMTNPKPKIPKHSPLLSCVVISRQLLIEVGGWDCVFQTQAIGNIDLSARLIKDGMKYIIQDLVCSSCGWMDKETGDHGPIHIAQIEEDMPILNKMYENYNKSRVIVPLDNWKNTDEVWRKKRKLSIVVPGIRKEKWVKYYDSVCQAYSGSWELIIIGPYDIPDELKAKKNVRWIEDWGCPTRCLQLGVIDAQGEYVMFSTDDSVFYPDMIDKAFDLVKGEDYKTVVSSKYLESDLELSKELMIKDAYYTVHFHQPIALPSIPKDFKLFNTGIVTKKLLKELGGFDCVFESTAIAYVDLAVRMQFYGAKIIMQDGFLCKTSWSADRSADPVTQSVWEHDIPFYQSISKITGFKNRIKLDINNWKYSPSKWERRWEK